MIAAGIAGIWMVCCAVFALAIITAPFGFEDARGFHLGEPNEPQAALDTPRAVNCAPGPEQRAGGAFVSAPFHIRES